MGTDARIASLRVPNTTDLIPLNRCIVNFKLSNSVFNTIFFVAGNCDIGGTSCRNWGFRRTVRLAADIRSTFTVNTIDGVLGDLRFVNIKQTGIVDTIHAVFADLSIVNVKRTGTGVFNTIAVVAFDHGTVKDNRIGAGIDDTVGLEF